MTDPKIPTLKALEGTQVLAMIPFLNAQYMELVMLHRVEEYGIWIEHQKSVEKFLQVGRAQAAPKTPLFFVPWAAVVAIFGSRDVPALSEQALS
jgi:hypothetical protein